MTVSKQGLDFMLNFFFYIQKYEISVQLLTFPVENIGFDEYGSRAWTVYFANTIQKILKIQWGEGEFERPHWVRRWARVDSRLKLTFGQLVK